MSRNNRITLELTELSLESVTKVFNFLENVLKDYLLDLDMFEEKIQKYSLLEQYFICEYGSIYYSKQKINSLLKSRSFTGYEDFQIQSIKENADNFINGVEGMRESLKKLAKNHKRKYGDFVTFKLPDGFIEKPINFRLPLYFAAQTAEDFEKRFGTRSKTKSDFKQEVYSILEDFLQKEDIELLFNNSFAYSTNPYQIVLLYLTITNKTEFKKKMLRLYTSYSEYYQRGKSEYENYYKKYYSELAHQIKDKKIKKTVLDSRGLLVDTGEFIELTETRSKFYPKLDTVADKQKFINSKELFHLPEITKEHFGKILYNSFVHIREGYVEKAIENPGLTLEQHLKKASTELRN
ncbi:hypothetical protein [Chryseobacterium indoltheticum]|uniref:Uncharacterized protein n=1 Tax=Chryseobacterium indoltheticum TaxID=254 RepID=A0A381FJH5_9FLAO|nr:hypothetical protein [Chryseobacterium indoltheticum]SUX46623.1 Uncharacterised protein [Chryseobacterium indoltheticum]